MQRIRFQLSIMPPDYNGQPRDELGRFASGPQNGNGEELIARPFDPLPQTWPKPRPGYKPDIKNLNIWRDKDKKKKEDKDSKETEPKKKPKDKKKKDTDINEKINIRSSFQLFN